MKRSIILTVFSILFTFSLASVVSANDYSVTDWFIEIPQSDLNAKSLNTTVTNDNYLFLHNDGASLDASKINDFIDGEIDINESENFNILGVGKYELDGKIYTDFTFSNLQNEDYTNIRENTLEKALKIYSGNNSSYSAKSSKDHMDSYTFRVNDGSTLAGIFTSSVDYLYKGTGTLNNKTVSVWDVKYFNQSEPKSSYQTREIITRFAINDWANQTLRSYGPFTTPKNNSATISLSGLVPTLGWSFSTFSSSVTDNSSIANKYARWIFKPVLGTNTAKTSYVMEPGARITNAAGSVGFKTTHNIDYYKNLNGQSIFNTGALTRFLIDR